MLEWLKANWVWVLTVALPVLVSTIAVKWIDFYGKDHPAATKALRFVLSLLSLLPARNATSSGVRLMVGSAELQVPGLSISAAKPKTRAGRKLTV